MKNGYSLIETLVVISIMILFFSTSISIISISRKVTSKSKYQVCNIEIVDFVNSARRYCRENSVPGYIICDTKTSIMKFICNSRVIYKLKMPEGFTLSDLNASNGNILINSRGITGSACTIKYMDDNKELHLITMRVGTFYVEIKQ